MNSAKEITREVLRTNRAARASDIVLVREVYARLGADVNLPFDVIMSDDYVWSRNLPPFASIIRWRRFLQQEDPTLVDEEAQMRRMENRERLLSELGYNK